MSARRQSDRHGAIRLVLSSALLVATLAACAGLERVSRTHSSEQTSSPVIRESDGSYDYIEMYRLYNMAEAAWDGEESFRDTDWKLEFFEHKETLTRGVAIESDDILYISFRATSAEIGKADRIYNLRIHQRPPAWIDGPSPVQVHRGFMSRYEAVRDDVLNRILASDAHEIVFTGASAGGALSLLAFMDALVLLDDAKPLHHVSFGMPRIFDAGGARWMRTMVEDRSAPTSIVRIVNGNDPIPALPPPLFGYRHVTPAHHIGPPARWYLVSGADHHPGYRNTLRRLADISGAAIEELPYSRGP